MEFDKLSLGSPMAEGHPEEQDLVDVDNLLHDDTSAKPTNPVASSSASRQALTLEPFIFPAEDSYCCEYVSSDTYNNRGAILQFINQNCADAATIIGGVRIPVGDPLMLPAYLARNRQLVKQYAVHHLTRHLVETQSAAGATECLSLDDYGMTFMLASISKAAKATHPLGRTEGPLLWCMYPRLNTPVTLYTNIDGTLEKAHIINVYVHLYDSNRRHRAIISRAVKAEEARFSMENNTPVQPAVAVAVKRKNSSTVSNGSSARNTQYVSLSNMQQTQRSTPHQVSVNAAQWQPSPPLPVMQPPPPPPPAPAPQAHDNEQFPPLPKDHQPLNWAMSPKLPNFPSV